jgi:hypothetical protein
MVFLTKSIKKAEEQSFSEKFVIVFKCCFKNCWCRALSTTVDAKLLE